MPDLSPGSEIGDFTIIRELGRGGMGVVYEAHEKSLQRRIALKVISEHLLADLIITKRFEREAWAVAQLSHPNIVHIYSLGQEGGKRYISMEYIKGRPLIELIRDEGPFDVHRALKITGQVAQALHMAHTKGIVHRDIKPHNIMIDEMGLARVLDFGLAHLGDAATRFTKTAESTGTPDYMSPEQCEGGAITPATDIYSLGATLFHMLTGRTLFQGDSALALMHQIVNAPLPSVAQFRNGTPEPVLRILTKMLARDGADRYQDTKTLIRDLKKALKGAPVLMEQPKASPVAELLGGPATTVFNPVLRQSGSGLPNTKMVLIAAGVLVTVGLAIAVGLGYQPNENGAIQANPDDTIALRQARSRPMPDAKMSDLAKRVAALLPTEEEETFLRIPWRTDLLEARREANEQGKPIFLWLMNGNPLGCT